MIFMIGVGLVSSSCVTSLMIQPAINGLVVAEKFEYAVKQLENNPESYGPQNRLLYLLDYGFVLHLAGYYDQSIAVLERAKKEYDQLFTLSLTKEGFTWLMNDNVAPYRGEDFERVMINIVQAMNFVVLGNVEGALVEARNVDHALKLINDQYSSEQKNVYREDAFARLLMAILYESGGTQADFNDAFISYQKALGIYQKDYQANYGVGVPQILKENILAMSGWMGTQEQNNYKNIFPDVAYSSLQEKEQKAEVYLLHYHGLSPIKHQTSIPIPLPNGKFVKLAFPRYDKRIYDQKPGTFKAQQTSGETISCSTELVENVEAIAYQNLENRKLRVMAKAVLRSGGKYLTEWAMEENIRQGGHEEAADWFKYLSNLYNITSEQADLRSWQTLPAEVRLGRLILEPGTYQLYFNDKELAQVELQRGEKKFFLVRTNQ